MSKPGEKILTLAVVYQHPRVLLGYKKRGFGAGRWNGFGGKVEDGESIEESVKRELLEEVGIEPLKIEEVGELFFEFKNTGEKSKVSVFKVFEFSGEERETEEMKPKWFFLDEIPFRQMWPDDVYWLPLFFAGRKFRGKFIFADEENIIDKSMEILK
ncbi:MAG: 8-oxo-dGTP diphosphatase [Candidatus Paceibacterota bacterium]|nr:MAG: 8-oxo-dGTP diphosphatase [Candidatus Paceibacterota bacterium]